MIYNPEVILTSEEFIQTSTGNIIARSAEIHRPQSLEVPGGRCVVEREAQLRADLAPIQLNRYSHIGRGTVLRPCETFYEPRRRIPLTVGAHTVIGERCTVEAAAIGTGCRIGDRVTLSPRCILKDHVRVLDDACVPADMVVPPFAIVGGSPAKILGEQPESVSTLAQIQAVNGYKAIKVVPAAK